jgi:hypothetical protein
MIEIIKSIIKGVDTESSVKRVLLLWVGGIIWAFVNAATFLFHRKFCLPDELPGTIALYDFLLICGLAGLTVYERIKTPLLDNKDTNK